MKAVELHNHALGLQLDIGSDHAKLAQQHDMNIVFGRCQTCNKSWLPSSLTATKWVRCLI